MRTRVYSIIFVWMFLTLCGGTAQAASFLEDALTDGRKTITLPAGTYVEPVTMPAGVTLLGEARDQVILTGGVTLEEGAALKNLTVAQSGIKVGPDADALIEDVIVRDINGNGIETTGFGLLEIRRTKILGSTSKGMYLRWGKRVDVSALTVQDNREEGIDVRSNVRGSIRDSVVTGNGESGLEIVIGDSILDIAGNTVAHNSSAGMTLQFYQSSPDPGAIVISRNRFENNRGNGVDCGSPADHAEEGYFSRSLAFVDNSFADNGKRDLDKVCAHEATGNGNALLLGKKFELDELIMPVAEKTRQRMEIERVVDERLLVAERQTDELRQRFAESQSRIENRSWIWLRVVGVEDDALDGLRALRNERKQIETEFKDLAQRTVDPARQQRIHNRFEELERTGQEYDDVIDLFKKPGFLGWFR